MKVQYKNFWINVSIKFVIPKIYHQDGLEVLFRTNTILVCDKSVYRSQGMMNVFNTDDDIVKPLLFVTDTVIQSCIMTKYVPVSSEDLKMLNMYAIVFVMGPSTFC